MAARRRMAECQAGLDMAASVVIEKSPSLSQLAQQGDFSI